MFFRLHLGAAGLLACIACVSAASAVLDRVAVVVGNQVITESELLEELRVTEFLNGQPLDLGPTARRGAGERLVDQQLIRNDMEMGGYSEPKPAEAGPMLAKLKKERFHGNEQEYRAALEHYGITEEQLKQHLLWQLAVMRFTDVRFNASIPQQPALDGAESQTANRMQEGADPPEGNSVDQQLEAWLKQARGDTRIQFKKEAFQ